MTGLYRHFPPGLNDEERKADRRRTRRFVVRLILGCATVAIVVSLFAK